MSLKLLKYKLQSQAICLGERKKKGTYRSSILTIPYSQISGALRAVWGLGDGEQGGVHAVGLFTKPDPANAEAVKRHTVKQIYARRDVAIGLAVLPIETRLLRDVHGHIYVLANDFTDVEEKKGTLRINMGAYRQKGLGQCDLFFTSEHTVGDGDLIAGVLQTRIPQDLATLFGISQVMQPVYGYLFRPDEYYEGGTYVRSLFEGSVVRGPRQLVKEIV